ncbi:MAG: GlxA family transcriptional regulator [Thiolinea sp.]
MDIEASSVFLNERPYRVGFLLVDGFALMSYAACIEPLRAANTLANKTLYEIYNMPAAGSGSVSSGGAAIKANAHLGERVDFDLVIVAAGDNPSAFRDLRIFQWLRHLSSRGVVLGGISGGPAILASAGVMRNRRMTLHWQHIPTLKELHPRLRVERSLYVVDRDRMTCAGGTAPLDMMHALISGHHGNTFAKQVCEWFLHKDIRPGTESQHHSMATYYKTNNASILSVIALMRANLSEPLTLDELAATANIGPRQLNRLFHDHMSSTTMAFYRDLRLIKARDLLAESPLSITDIALATGFANSAHFSQAYKTKFGVRPSANRSAQQAAMQK